MVEADIAGPRRAAKSGVRVERFRHQVREPRRVADEHHVELATFVGRQRIGDVGAEKLDLGDVAGPLGTAA